MPTSHLRPLGRIARLQIQRSGLKLGQKPHRRYDPAPLLAVDELTLTPDGAVARLADGPALLDIHHVQHPETRNVEGSNDLSLGFTAHYAAMRDCFGPHLVDGVAGENILVEASTPVALAELANGVAVRRAGGGELVWLRQARVAAPCVEFSTFAARASEPAAMKAALQFLDNGMRGFYLAFDGPGTATIAVGDEVCVPA